ncbi:hypothetical protein [uncultured Nostoc sp.]|uniref:hypothetical protein n=1 Tax=uncultured Nostoc sp. TaxID=340711 RepID=UPI0035CB80CE
MNFNQDFTTQEKVEKAVWAATVFCKYKYRNWDIWLVEHITTTRMIVGNANSGIRKVIPEGTGEDITVRSGLGAINYGWWEAVAIASAIEEQKSLPGS